MQTLPNAYYRISVKGLIRDPEGRLLLLKESNGKYDLPGGGLDHGEKPQAGLRREIHEETGLDVIEIAQTPAYFVAVDTPAFGYIANVIYPAVCQKGHLVASDECVELCYFSKEELAALPKEFLLENVQEFLKYYLSS